MSTRSIRPLSPPILFSMVRQIYQLDSSPTTHSVKLKTRPQTPFFITLLSSQRYILPTKSKSVRAPRPLSSPHNSSHHRIPTSTCLLYVVLPGGHQLIHLPQDLPQVRERSRRSALEREPDAPVPAVPGGAIPGPCRPLSWSICFDWEREAGLLNQIMLIEQGEGLEWTP